MRNCLSNNNCSSAQQKHSAPQKMRHFGLLPISELNEALEQQLYFNKNFFARPNGPIETVRALRVYGRKRGRE